MSFYGLTDVGKKRRENEDRFRVSNDKQYGILADGMGGRLYGEVASTMAVDILSHHIDEELPASLQRLERTDQAAVIVNMLDDWIRDVNAAIHRKGQEDEKFQEMGTTLVALFGLDRLVVLAHVGDSRCYHYSKTGLKQVTEDHSFVNSQVKSGMLTEEEAKESKQRNIITRAVGTAPKVKPEIKVLHAQRGDRFMLCSDGLHDQVPEAKIQEVLEKRMTLPATAKALVDEANAAGGRDNITVVLAEVG